MNTSMGGGPAATRVLYISPGGIGNQVMAEPALRALQLSWPAARTTLLTAEPRVHEILAPEGLFADHICFDRGHSQGVQEIWALVAALRAQRYDLGLTAGTVEPLSAGLLMLCSGIPRRVGENIGGRGIFYTHRASWSPGTHERDGALAVVEAAGGEAGSLLPEIHPSEEERQAAAAFLAARGWRPEMPLAGMHAGSGEAPAARRKRWPAERFAAVARALAARGMTVFLTAGPAERDLAAGIASAAGPGVICSDGTMPVRHTAAAASLCRVFVGNDSGVVHVAAAVGAPVVALFGPSDPARVAPKGKRVRVLLPPDQGEDMAGITVDQVLAATAQMGRG